MKVKKIINSKIEDNHDDLKKDFDKQLSVLTKKKTEDRVFERNLRD